MSLSRQHPPFPNGSGMYEMCSNTESGLERLSGTARPGTGSNRSCCSYCQKTHAALAVRSPLGGLRDKQEPGGPRAENLVQAACAKGAPLTGSTCSFWRPAPSTLQATGGPAPPATSSGGSILLSAAHPPASIRTSSSTGRRMPLAEVRKMMISVAAADRNGPNGMTCSPLRTSRGMP